MISAKEKTVHVNYLIQSAGYMAKRGNFTMAGPAGFGLAGSAK